MQAILSVDMGIENEEGFNAMATSLMSGESLAMKIAQPEAGESAAVESKPAPEPEVSAAAVESAESVKDTTPPSPGAAAAEPAESVGVGESVGTTPGVFASASTLSGTKASFVASGGKSYPRPRKLAPKRHQKMS